jgi:folylpolyglutamate synthase/dihydropteroate synthase
VPAQPIPASGVGDGMAPDLFSQTDDPAAALAALGSDDAVVTGSVYLVGEARGLLIEQGWVSDAG